VGYGKWERPAEVDDKGRAWGGVWRRECGGKELGREKPGKSRVRKVRWERRMKMTTGAKSEKGVEAEDEKGGVSRGRKWW